MHSPLEIARTYVDVSIHKTHLSAFKMIILGMFAGIFIGFAGIGSTTASSTVANPSLAKLLGAVVFPAGMAMVLVAGSELFTGNTLIILAVLEKKIPVYKMLKNWFFVFTGNFLGAALVAFGVVCGHTPDLFNGDLAGSIVAAHPDAISVFLRAWSGESCVMCWCVSRYGCLLEPRISPAN